MNSTFYTLTLAAQNIVETTLPYVKLWILNTKPSSLPPAPGFTNQLKNKLIGMGLAYDALGHGWAGDWVRRVVSSSRVSILSVSPHFPGFVSSLPEDRLDAQHEVDGFDKVDSFDDPWGDCSIAPIWLHDPSFCSYIDSSTVPILQEILSGVSVFLSGGHSPVIHSLQLAFSLPRAGSSSLSGLAGYIEMSILHKENILDKGSGL